MCGIVGYIGQKDASQILLDGLRKLEYRGYDSAGIAIHTADGLEIVKEAGRIARLSEEVARKATNGSVGMHTHDGRRTVLPPRSMHIPTLTPTKPSRSCTTG